jgi:hypothetical protein
MVAFRSREPKQNSCDVVEGAHSYEPQQGEALLKRQANKGGGSESKAVASVNSRTRVILGGRVPVCTCALALCGRRVASVRWKKFHCTHNRRGLRATQDNRHLESACRRSRCVYKRPSTLSTNTRPMRCQTDAVSTSYRTAPSDHAAPVSQSFPSHVHNWPPYHREVLRSQSRLCKDESGAIVCVCVKRERRIGQQVGA